MDQQILEHANALFALKFKEISRRQREELKAIHADANRRGLSNSGISLSNQLKSQALAIGHRMRARLESFRETFETANIQPLPEDFEYIWANTSQEYTHSVATTNQQIWRQAKIMGLPNPQALIVDGDAAHYHDEVLAEFNVWRSKVGLVGVTQTLATSRIPPLAELKDKAACVADLQALLGSNKQTCAALLYIDLDNFKAVNDANGHAGGDQCIEAAATIISSVVHYKGRVYRLHVTGDEFAVILPNYDESEARATAERIRSTVEQQKPGGDVRVTTSIGGFVATGDIAAEEVIQKADQAMFVAKKARNTVHFD
jgi:diguanylate cyclase (GGDEF)-like protein